MKFYRKIWNKIVPYSLRKKLSLGARLKLDPDVKTLLEQKYMNSDDNEIKNFIKALEKENIGAFVEKYHTQNIQIYRDAENWPYTILFGRKMFLKRSFSDDDARKYVTSLLIEQDKESPHRYLDEMHGVYEGDVVFDIGGAEGIFALEILDNAKEIHIFECDDEWVNALYKTFEPYQGKICIVKKFVSDSTDEKSNTISLDDYSNEINILPDFVKMDIEGAEIDAIRGAKKILEEKRTLRLSLCTYHRESDYDNLVGMLKGQFNIRTNRGYMLYYDYQGDGAPYLARGVIKCKHV